MACSVSIRRALAGIVMVCLALSMKAQQDPAFVQYWMIETQYNPAAVGKQDQLNISAALQSHAMGFDDAGTTLYAGVDAAFQVGKSRHGVGGSFQADNIGIFSHKKVSVAYAYQLKMGKQKVHRLSIGASADMLAESADGSKADTEDGNDPAFGSGQMDGSRIDASVGLYYQWKDFFSGLSLMHVTAPEVELGETNIYKVKRLYNLNAGYTFRTRNPYFKVTPSAMLRTDLWSWRADATVKFAFERDSKNFNFGADYAPMHSFAVFIGCVFHGINICYSYEANTEGMGIGAGQHEVTLGYKLDLNLGKKGRNLHKTVRWL